MIQLSNKPAPYVGINVGALCELPKKSIWQRLLGKDPDPTPLVPQAQYGFRMLNEKYNYNIMIMVEDPDLWHFAQVMIDHHDLPVQQKMLVTEWDHYSLIRASFTMGGVLWAGETCPISSAECVFCPPDKDIGSHWFMFLDGLGSVYGY